MASTARNRVLVADDNEINRQFVGTVLRREGISVLEATDGQEAVDLCRGNRVALVLMDIRMPGMDGVAATRAIRQAGVAQPIIIALTADARNEEKERLLGLGFDDYLAKPIGKKGLLQAVHSALEQGPAPEPVAGEESEPPSRSEPLDRESALRTLGGNEELWNKLLEMFARELPDSAAQIEGAVKNGEHEAAAELAHKLRSSASYCGALEFERRLRTLELALGRNNPDRIEEAMAEYRSECDAVTDALPQPKES